MAHGAAMGISRGESSLLQELSEIRPTVLYAVPQLFTKVYNAIQTKVPQPRSGGHRRKAVRFVACSTSFGRGGMTFCST